MGRRRVSQFCLVLALLSASFAPEASALGTAFTYQGSLQKGDGPTDGACDFRFLLFHFGAAAFSAGDDRWL